MAPACRNIGKAAPGPDNLFVLAQSAQLVSNRLAGTLFAALAIKLALFRN